MTPMEIVEMTSNVIVILGGILGGIWAYYKFKKLRAIKKALTLKISPTIYHHKGEVVVEILVEFFSNGTIPIFVLPDGIKDCLIHVKKIPSAGDNLLLDLNAKEFQDIVEPIQYLNQYSPTYKIPITLEPGVPAEVHGYGIFATKYQGLLLLHVEFYDSEGTPWIEGKVINTTKEKVVSK